MTRRLYLCVGVPERVKLLHQRYSASASSDRQRFTTRAHHWSQ